MEGPSGATELLTGLIYRMAAVLTGGLVVMESYLPGRWYFWGGAILLVVCVLLSRSVFHTLRAKRRLAEEKRRGYTTAMGDALEDPSLYYVDRKTLRIVAGPYEPRKTETS
jgi:hypothetical protein